MRREGPEIDELRMPRLVLSPSLQTTLLTELPRTPDVPLDRGPGAWERHKARLKAAGGQAGPFVARLQKAKLAARPVPVEDPGDAAARTAKAALMNMSDAMDDTDRVDKGEWGEWGDETENLSGASATLSPPAERSQGVPSEVPVAVWANSHTEFGGARSRSDDAQSPTSKARPREDRGFIAVPSVHERLASQPLSRGIHGCERRRRDEPRVNVSKSAGRNDPVLAWGYSPAGRSGRISPAGSSASSISSGPSSPRATERERGATKSPPPEPFDERVNMYLFAGDEALAQGRHDTAIAKFEDALSYCLPQTASFRKLQQRLLHARRVQSEVRRVVADWLQTRERPITRNVSSPVVGTGFVHAENSVDSVRQSDLLRKRLGSAASSPVNAGAAGGFIQPVVQRGSAITQNVHQPRARSKAFGSRGSPFEVPKKGKVAKEKIPVYCRDKAFPARMPGAVAARSTMHRPARATLNTR